MISPEYIAMFGLVGGALARPASPPANWPNFPTNAGCAQVNVFYTGFPAYHPYVQAQGFGGDLVNRSLRNGTANLLKKGYNVHVFFQDPELPVSNIADRMKGKKWDVDVIGFGVRGFPNATATTVFEDWMYQFQKSAPLTPTVFNWGPDASFVEGVSRHIPLKGDCTYKPGKLLAYEEVCDHSICKKTTVILDGDAGKLLEGI